MKKSLSLLLMFVLCLSLFSLTACSKKVESDEHFGYKLDYIEEHFPYDSINYKSELIPHSIPEMFRLVDSSDDETIFRFESVCNPEGYCDCIGVHGRTPEEVIGYIDILNREFDLFDDDIQIDSKVYEGGVITIGNIGMAGGIRINYVSDKIYYYIQLWKTAQS